MRVFGAGLIDDGEEVRRPGHPQAVGNETAVLTSHFRHRPAPGGHAHSSPARRDLAPFAFHRTELRLPQADSINRRDTEGHGQRRS